MTTLTPHLLNLAIATFGLYFGCQVYKSLRELDDLKLFGNCPLSFDEAAAAIEKIAGAVVGKLEQTTGADLKRLVKEGKLTRDSLYELAKEAYGEICGIASDEIMIALDKGVKDISLYIHDVIESEVRKLKTKSTTEG